MILRYSASVTAALALSAFAAWAMPAQADEPIPYGDAVTVYRQVTVQASYDGLTAREWARRARVNKRGELRQHRDSQARGQTIRRLRQANRDRLQLGPIGLTAAFLCIHHYEGSWTAATGNGYHGGLQMDGNFMAAYGGPFLRALGTADRWPPFVQVTVAMAAYYSGRGFFPWPNTARACGLL